MRRWFLRILVGVAILIAVVIAIVQVVLWSPLPKRIVLEQIEKELGLRISADTLSTGWLGKSELTNVSLGLPLSPDDFLKVKVLKIQHSSLLGLALGQVVVKSIEIDNPQVEVVQNSTGQWNLQQVIDLLGRVGGGTSSQNSSQSKSSSTGIPQLPIIQLNDGSIHITDNLKHTASLQPLNITGKPDGALVWRYELSIADSIAMTGEVAPGGNWQHQISLQVHDLDPLVKDWGVPSTYGAAIKAHWDGQISNGKLTGVLALDQASASQLPGVGDVKFDGSVNAEIDGPVVTLSPNLVDLRTSNLSIPDIAVQAGTIVSDGAGLHAWALKLKAFGGLANVDGNFDPRTMAVDLKAGWSGLSLAKKTSQSGSLTASLREPFTDQPVIVVNLDDVGTVGGIATAGTAPPGRYKAKLNLTAQGSSWKSIDWELTAPQLTYSTATQTVDLSRLSAHVSQRLPVVELTSLSLPTNSGAIGTAPINLNSSGKIDFASNHWSFDLAGGFNTRFQNTPVPLTLALHALGSTSRVDLKSLAVGIADMTVTADGSYDSSLPTPVDLHVLLAQTPRVAPDSPVQGEVGGDFKIVGDLFKGENGRRFRPYLTTTGDLRSSDLILFNRPVGDLDVKLDGDTSTPNLPGGEPGPCITKIHTVDFNLFQAPWDLTVDFPNADGNVEASLQTRKLELEEVAKFAKVSGISGMLNAKWVAVIPSMGLSGLNVYSEYHLTDLTAAGVAVDKVDATATISDGILRLNPLVARRGSGTITTTASVDLQNPRTLTTQLTVDHWSYPLSSDVAAIASANGNAVFDLKARDLGASGSLSATTDLILDGKTQLGHAELAATVLHRDVSIDKLDGNVLTGKFSGVANLDLDKPLTATGQVVWAQVDGAAVATVFPQLNGLAGQYSGTITLEPARDPRPLEPVRLDVNVAATDGHFRTMNLGGKGLLAVHAVGYLNTDRAVLDHSDIYLAGGALHIWARAGYRPGARLATQAAIDFDHLQLDQLARVDTKITKPMPGLLGGHIGVIRSGILSSQVLGQAQLVLTQADLGNFGPIAALYSVMHVGGGPASGTGTVSATFEQNKLRITDFRYFNQGIEARGLCTLGPIDYAHLPGTRIDGQVVGTARPLANTRIPLLADFDSVFNAFQGSLTTINVLGTLDKPAYPPALVTDIGNTLRNLLVGEAEGSGNTPP